jgi:hypothetical protein
MDFEESMSELTDIIDREKIRDRLVRRARVTSQTSIAARSGTINWDDLNWERTYDGMAAYRQSKIAFGLFGLELSRRSTTVG